MAGFESSHALYLSRLKSNVRLFLQGLSYKVHVLSVPGHGKTFDFQGFVIHIQLDPINHTSW